MTGAHLEVVAVRCGAETADGRCGRRIGGIVKTEQGLRWEPVEGHLRPTPVEYVGGGEDWSAVPTVDATNRRVLAAGDVDLELVGACKKHGNRWLLSSGVTSAVRARARTLFAATPHPTR